MFGKREVLIITLGVGLVLACLYAAGCVIPPVYSKALCYWTCLFRRHSQANADPPSLPTQPASRQSCRRCAATSRSSASPRASRTAPAHA